MPSKVEPAEGNKVKLTVEVPADEFERDVDAAFKRIAREVSLPGFRPGKAPRKVLEARIGAGAARAEALQHALPDYYAAAIAEHEIDVIAQPEIDVTSGEDEGVVTFDAVVEVRPEVNVAGYASLRVEIDSPEVSDDDVDARIESLRQQHSQLEPVERAAAEGDTVSIDITGSRDGEPLDGLTAEGYQYRVGSGTIVSELDEALTGASTGDDLEFSADHPGDGEPVDFEVHVGEVRATVLPDADDDFAREAGDADSIDALRADLRERLAGVKKVQGAMAVREGTAEALGALVDDELPEALIDAEMQTRVQDLAMRLAAQGIELSTYLQATGQDPAEFEGQLREAAVSAARIDLALRAVAAAEGIEVDDDELDAEIDGVAERLGQSPAKVREQFERNAQIALVRSDLRTRKAMQWVLERVEVVDRDGGPIDRDALLADPEDEVQETPEPDEADATETPDEQDS
ncbi:MAG: trigger factor [Acidimicrobiales bacterium]|nr:trigger factor [Acidimicrobiales bacterium]